MYTYDILMLLVFFAALAHGAWRGVTWQVASVLSIALSYWVALQFRGTLAEWLGGATAWNRAMAMLILFGGTWLLVWAGCRLVRKLLDRIKLKEFDHQIGGVLGAVKGVLYCMLITLFAVTLLGEGARKKIVDSYSGHLIATLLDKADPILPSEVRDVLHPYLHEVLEEQPDEGKSGDADR